MESFGKCFCYIQHDNGDMLGSYSLPYVNISLRSFVRFNLTES